MRDVTAAVSAEQPLTKFNHFATFAHKANPHLTFEQIEEWRKPWEELEGLMPRQYPTRPRPRI